MGRLEELTSFYSSQKLDDPHQSASLLPRWDEIRGIVPKGKLLISLKKIMLSVFDKFFIIFVVNISIFCDFFPLKKIVYNVYYMRK